MPNLNLMDDESEESPLESFSAEEELGLDEPSGALRKILPIAAGGVLALALAAFLLNMTGIIHLWGPKKAPSVMVEVPADAETQMLSDSAMEAQFRLDSAQLAAEVAPLLGEKAGTANEASKKSKADIAAAAKAAEKKSRADIAAAKEAEKKKLAEAAAIKKESEMKQRAEAAEAKKAAEKKRLADAAAAKKKAEEQRIADAAAAKQKAEERRIADAAVAKQKADEKKAADEAAATILAEKRKAAERERSNMTYVEVPGYPIRRSAIVEPKPVAKKPVAVKETPKAETKKTVAVKETPKPVAKKPVAVKETPKPVAKKPVAVKETLKPEPVKKAVAVKESAKPEAKKSVAVKESPASEPGGEKYSVQISSWLSAAKARTQARQYTDAGIRAFVTTTGRIFRVCIGQYSSHADAVQRAEELAPMLETKYDIIRVK